MFLKIKKYIRKKKLLQTGDKILVAVSGGADSVALLDILDCLVAEYKLSLHVVHLNHLFRGEEAKEDARFVREIATKRGLPFSSLTFDVPAYCAKYRLSPQDAARRVRYGVFLQIARRVGANKMALGHHRDDQVETLLLNLLRGTGTGGLTGMQPVRTWGKRQEDKHLIRPLLEVSRTEIEDHLSRGHLSFRLDKSNLKEVYLRNRVRLNLLPLLKEEYNPSIDKALLSLSSIISETEDYLEEKTQQVWKKVFLAGQINGKWEVGSGRLDAGRGVRSKGRGVESEKWGEKKNANLRREDFLRLHPALQTRILLRLWEYLFPRGKGLGYRHIESLRNLIVVGKTGSSLALPGKIKAELSYGCLSFRNPMEAAAEIHFSPTKIKIPGETVLPEQKVKLTAFVFARKKITGPFASGMEADLDYDTVSPFLGELTLRRRLPGDRFHPLGVRGNKKIEDFLIDRKTSRDLRPTSNPFDSLFARSGQALPLPTSNLNGSKKLKDFLIDKKVPREKRESLYLAAAGEEIFWVAGLEINDKYKVTAKTKKVLRLKLEVKGSNEKCT